MTRGAAASAAASTAFCAATFATICFANFSNSSQFPFIRSPRFCWFYFRFWLLFRSSSTALLRLALGNMEEEEEEEGEFNRLPWLGQGGRAAAGCACTAAALRC
jgi:hypothetical protein